jgi:two-component system sensor histidine kinase DegS
MFLASNKPHEYFSHEDQLLAAISNVIGVAIENATLFYNVKAHETRLRQLLERMLKVREEEQKRIAADIHDSVAQWMISASYRTQSCSALLSEWRVDEAGDEIDHIKKLIEQSVAELRRLIVDLYPPTLAEVGLEQALCQNIGSFQSETGIVCHFQVEGTLKRISPSLEMAVYRIVQESMNNVRKHSHATELSIRLRFEPNEVWAEIRDNGHGFSVDKILGDETMLGHMGLITMKDRAETLGGSLAITASPGAGTSIILTLPVSPHQSSLGAEEP